MSTKQALQTLFAGFRMEANERNDLAMAQYVRLLGDIPSEALSQAVDQLLRSHQRGLPTIAVLRTHATAWLKAHNPPPKPAATPSEQSGPLFSPGGLLAGVTDERVDIVCEVCGGHGTALRAQLRAWKELAETATNEYEREQGLVRCIDCCQKSLSAIHEQHRRHTQHARRICLAAQKGTMPTPVDVRWLMEHPTLDDCYRRWLDRELKKHGYYTNREEQER